MSAGVVSAVEEITPAMAAKYLEANTHNRRLNKNAVAQYVGAMKRGEWKLNGDAIKFDINGVLQDGQTRLTAIIESGETIPMFVIRGLEPEAQATMDTGRKRTLGDILKLRGEANTPRLAGALNVLYNYENVGTMYTGSVKPPATPQQLIDFLDKYPDVRTALKPPYASIIDHFLTPSTASALYYLFRSVDTEDAREFYRLLASGDGLGEGDPIFALRKRLEAEARKSQGRILPHVRAAFTIKAFNAWRAGATMHALKWTGGGARQEGFPRVLEATITPKVDLPDPKNI